MKKIIAVIIVISVFLTAMPAQVFAAGNAAEDMYEKGMDLFEKSDYVSAFSYFQISGEVKGYAPSQNMLGLCYRDGLGTEPDLSLAEKYFTLAAGQGYAPAQENLSALQDKKSEAYQNAMNLYFEGRYEEAKAAFEALGDYERSADFIAMCEKAIQEQNNSSQVQNPASVPSEGPAHPSSLVSDAFIDPINDWAKYDDLIAQIKAETDFAGRAELMHRAEDILMSNYCVIPLYYYNDIYMQKDYVSGIYSNLFGNKFWMYAKLGNGSDTLRMNLSGEPDFIDPALSTAVDTACLIVNAFSGLYTYNEEGVPVPACAESYEVSEDGLTYIVTLKPGLKWSDGSALTAADFEYSWKRAVDPETAAIYEYMFSGFNGYIDGNLNVTALDDTTLVFVLDAPCAYMEDLMAFPTFYPVCKAYVEAHSDPYDPGAWCREAGFVSNGAFICTGWNHGVSMTYEKNPYWYDADRVSVKKVEFMLSIDEGAVFSAYEAGSLDFIDTVSGDGFEKYTGNPELRIVDELGTYYAAFNANSKLFADKTPAQAACMRQAFSLLIDRDYIVRNIGQTGQVPANAYVPLGMADGNGGIFKKDPVEEGYYDPYAINNDYEGTVDRAVELLEAAGYKFENGVLSAETPISVEYLTNQSSGHVAIAESMQQDLAVIGIEMTIRIQDWNVFIAERRLGNFDFAREGWVADFNDPINMLEMFTTDSGTNDCQFGHYEGWNT